MASITLSRITVIGTAPVTAVTGTATAGTMTSTIQDLSRSFVRMTNLSSTVTTLMTIGASADPMVASGIGTLQFSIAPDESVYFGGSWDSARYKTTAGTIVITTDSTIGGVTFEVWELPPY